MSRNGAGLWIYTYKMTLVLFDFIFVVLFWRVGRLIVLHSRRRLVAASGSELRDPNGSPAGRACISTWELSLPYLRDYFHKKLNLKLKAIESAEGGEELQV